ncbi:MAG: alpha/beta hydrolase [Deltaproteobacteria bacterium]|nr:alpha/beta hydrolase [Deltaproteobacteria bacterium]
MDLDDELFSEENGIKGYWEPASFFKDIGGNIYFIEEYDPKKIPILFIHGAGDTPKGWKYFIDNIDRTRFQPWFFYYPSGTRIQSMAHLLSWKLGNLQIKYSFDHLYITAHSMGGLVARSFIMDHGSVVPLFLLDRYSARKCVYPITIQSKNARNRQLLHVFRPQGKP